MVRIKLQHGNSNVYTVRRIDDSKGIITVAAILRLFDINPNEKNISFKDSDGDFVRLRVTDDNDLKEFTNFQAQNMSGTIVVRIINKVATPSRAKKTVEPLVKMEYNESYVLKKFFLGTAVFLFLVVPIPLKFLVFLCIAAYLLFKNKWVQKIVNQVMVELECCQPEKRRKEEKKEEVVEEDDAGLAKLSSLGFVDMDLNRKMLKKCDGNVLQAIQKLLK